MNSVDECYLVGFTADQHAEFIRRPIIIYALELCSPQVVDLLLNFGADLAKYHDGQSSPLLFFADVSSLERYTGA